MAEYKKEKRTEKESLEANKKWHGEQISETSLFQ